MSPFVMSCWLEIKFNNLFECFFFYVCSFICSLYCSLALNLQESADAVLQIAVWLNLAKKSMHMEKLILLYIVTLE